MSLTTSIIDALLVTGVTRDQLAAAMKADIAERDALEAARLEAKRAGNRERQQRKRAKDAPSRKVTPVTRDDCDTPPNERDNLTPREVSETIVSSPQPWSLPIGVSLQVWTDLKANRKRKRLPNTPTAWKGFLEDLARVSSQTGIPPPKLIEMCTAKGWGAIYDPRDQDNGRTNGMGRHQSDDGLSATSRAALAVFGAGEQRTVPQ